MIQQIVNFYFEQQKTLEESFIENLPGSYKELVYRTIKSISDHEYDEFFSPDPEKMIELNHGHHTGVNLYIMPEKGYEPMTYFVVKIIYGSCGACDTMQNILENESNKEQQIKDLMTLSLHVIQNIKTI
jgi:hypothetical protein